MVFAPIDEDLIGKAAHAGYAYFRRGRTLHGSDVAPAVRHLGHKIAKVSKYMQFAHAGYKLGKKFVNSFSQKEKNNMPPVKRRLSYSSSSSSAKSTKNTTPWKKSMPPALRATATRKLQKAQRVSRQYNARLTGKVKRGTRKVSIKARFEKLGVANVCENNGIYDTSGSPVCIIGHGTYVNAFVARTCFAALIKHLFAKLHVPIANMNDSLSGNIFNVGDAFQFQWQANPAEIISTVSVTLVAADLNGTIDQFVIKLCNEICAQAYPNTGDGSNQVKFGRFQFVPIPTGQNRLPNVVINLSDSVFDVYMKSDLKIQNQSVSVLVDNQSDSVNNVPIYGKTYEGSGTGFDITNRLSPTQVNQIRINAVSGLIVDQAKDSLQVFEPYQRKHFKHVTREGRISINPGDIKTSTLMSRIRISFDMMVRNRAIIFSGLGDAITPDIRRGKFRVMMLDKVIGLAAATGVKVAYENNSYIASIFKPRYGQATLPAFYSNPITPA